MKKNRHIFLLGILFFLFALCKYLFLSVELSTTFFVFEVLSFLVVLYVIYYVLNHIDSCVQGSEQGGMDKECVKRLAEIDRLKKKLEQYENRNAEGAEKSNDRSDLISEMKDSFNGYNEQAANDLLSCIIKRYEVMAAVAYYRKDEVFEPSRTFGIDEDASIASIKEDDGIHAQAIKDNKAMEITDVPENYIVGSGSGSSKPLFLYILPLIGDDKESVVLEVASFKKLDLETVWNQLQLS